MLYWESQAKRYVFIDSLNTRVISDCENALVFSNEKIKEQSLVVDSLKNEMIKQEDTLKEERERKKRWRRTTFIAIPLSVLSGLILSLFL
jgi:hypothetical protein